MTDFPKRPAGVDRPTSLMRSAVISATAAIASRRMSEQERAQRAADTPPPLAADLHVVKGETEPVMTTLDECCSEAGLAVSVTLR